MRHTELLIIDILVYSLLSRLRGGVVLVDRLPRDSQGTLMVNLDKFDSEAVAVTSFEERERFPTFTVTSI